MSKSLVELEERSRVLYLHWNDPEKANCLSEAILDETLLKLKKIKVEKFDILVFSSRGRFFCSGGDLKHFANLKTKSEGLKLNRKIKKQLKEFSELKIYKLAFVNGDCFGGGMEFLSCFNHRISCPQAIFGLWQTKLSLSFSWGGSERWAKYINIERLRSDLLQSKHYSSHEALKMGFVDEIMIEAHLPNRIKQLTQHYISIPTKTRHHLLEADITNEDPILAKLWWTDEHQAILKKRLKK